MIFVRVFCHGQRTLIPQFLPSTTFVRRRFSCYQDVGKVERPHLFDWGQTIGPSWVVMTVQLLLVMGIFSGTLFGCDSFLMSHCRRLDIGKSEGIGFAVYPSWSWQPSCGRPVFFGRWPCRCSDQLVEECGRPIWFQTDFCFPSNLACLLGEVGLFLGRLFTLWLLIGWGRPAFLGSFPFGV